MTRARLLPLTCLFLAVCTPPAPVPTQNDTTDDTDGTTPAAPIVPPGAAVGTSTVSGKIVLAGVSDASQIAVTLAGPTVASALTAADGTYKFSALANGTYVLNVTVSDSLERTRTVGFVLNDTQMVPDITFTVVGTLTGQATRTGATDHSGTVVMLLGTAAQAVTDAAGSYRFDNVPLGARTLLASYPGFDNGTVMATLTRGTTAAPAIALTATTIPAPPMATISGRVTLPGVASSSSIQVSLIGAGTSPVNAAVDGSYTLMAPAGTYRLVADAPNYAHKDMGNVTITAGETLMMPPQSMTFYTGKADYFLIPVPQTNNSRGLWAAGLVTFPPSGTPPIALVDTTEGTQTTFWSGPSPNGQGIVFSKTSKWAAFTVTQGGVTSLFWLNTQTKRLTKAPWNMNIMNFNFTNDENALTVTLGSSVVGIVNMAAYEAGTANAARTISTAGMVDDFGTAQAELLADDKIAIRDGTNLVIGTFNTGAPNITFALGVSGVTGEMTPFGFSPVLGAQPHRSVIVAHGCSTTCNVAVLKTNGTFASLAPTASTPTTLSAGTNSQCQQTGANWIPCNVTGGTGALFHTSGAVISANTPYPSLASSFAISEASSFIAYDSAADVHCVEPLTIGNNLSCPSVVVVAPTGGSFAASWIDDSHYIGYDSTNEHVYLQTVPSGSVTGESAATGTFSTSEHLAYWKKPGVDTWRATARGVSVFDVPFTPAPTGITGVTGLSGVRMLFVENNAGDWSVLGGDSVNRDVFSVRYHTGMTATFEQMCVAPGGVSDASFLATSADSPYTPSSSPLGDPVSRVVVHASSQLINLVEPGLSAQYVASVPMLDGRNVIIALVPNYLSPLTLFSLQP